MNNPIPFDAQPVLTGDLITLRPLGPDDFDALYAIAADPRIWEQHPVSDRHEEARFREFFQDALASGGALIVSDRSNQRVIESSRYHGYDPARREVEIGWTFLAQSHWGRRYNGEMKRLMLDHAFRWVERVVFLVGPQNVRSQRAVERIGGRRVGMRLDGSGRESLVYEITASRYSPRIEIARAIPCDLDTVMGLVRACIARMQADAIDQWDEVYPSRSTFERDLTEGTLWLARGAGVCRGVMVLNERQDAEYTAVPWRYRHGSILIVHRLAVDPAAQGRGIAS